MSRLNLLIHLNAYNDQTETNNPSQNIFKWNTDKQGLSVTEPLGRDLRIQPGQSFTLFSGTVSTSDDGSTTWDFGLKPGSSTTYRITHKAGTAPDFRTARVEGHDATTAVTVTKNGKILKYTSTGGTPWSLVAGGAVVGDEVRIGTAFAINNQGKFKVLAVTATSFDVENEAGQAEGPIVLGAGFKDEVNIFSQDGVQVNDKIDIIADFSLVTFGTFDITDVNPEYVEFFSTESLPVEVDVPNSPSFLIYREAKQFLYVESNKKLDLVINGSATPNEIVPMNAGTKKQPGFFMSSASIKSAVITNKSQDLAQVFYATAE